MSVQEVSARAFARRLAKEAEAIIVEARDPMDVAAARMTRAVIVPFFYHMADEEDRSRMSYETITETAYAVSKCTAVMICASLPAPKRNPEAKQVYRNAIETILQSIERQVADMLKEVDAEP